MYQTTPRKYVVYGTPQSKRSTGAYSGPFCGAYTQRVTYSLPCCPAAPLHPVTYSGSLTRLGPRAVPIESAGKTNKPVVPGVMLNKAKKTGEESPRRRGSITLESNFDFAAARALNHARSGESEVYSWMNWAPEPNSQCYEALHKWFPGALPGPALHARVRMALESDHFGFTPENTIFGQSICPDEINNEKGGLADLMKEHWGEVFPMGGIGGAPFVGKTGFAAFSHHVPDNGNVLILFGPHIAISETGEIGKYLRIGQGNESTACGACIAAYKSCIDATSTGAGGETDFDPFDMQQAWIRQQLSPHASKIQSHANPMAALAHQSYEMVKAKMLGVVNNNFGSGQLVLVGGIQINMPKPQEDHFLPCMFEVRRKGEAPHDLMKMFQVDLLDRVMSDSLHAQRQTFHFLGYAPEPKSPCYESLHRWFPGALPGHAILARVRRVLESEKFGFTPENTLFGQSICPDEINNEKGDLADIMKNHWGEVFPMGGIGGAPFVGKTGFGAFSHHVPEDGNVFILFGPHVAVSTAGEVGQYLRLGQSHHSSACGACIAAYKQCLACNGQQPGDEAFDELDMQQAYIRKKLAPYVGNIQASENPMAALALQSYQIVEEKMLSVINTEFGSGYLVLVGGVQINMPMPLDDHFLPLYFQAHRKGQQSEDLMEAFNFGVSWDNKMKDLSSDVDIPEVNTLIGA